MYTFDKHSQSILTKTSPSLVQNIMPSQECVSGRVKAKKISRSTRSQRGRANVSTPCPSMLPRSRVEGHISRSCPRLITESQHLVTPRNMLPALNSSIPVDSQTWGRDQSKEELAVDWQNHLNNIGKEGASPGMLNNHGKTM
jgi:hypothetical protein